MDMPQAYDFHVFSAFYMTLVLIFQTTATHTGIEVSCEEYLERSSMNFYLKEDLKIIKKNFCCCKLGIYDRVTQNFTRVGARRPSVETLSVKEGRRVSSDHTSPLLRGGDF